MYNIENLKESINEPMPLSEIAKVFEEMCEEPIGIEMSLFDTGTFSFNGETLFY